MILLTGNTFRNSFSNIRYSFIHIIHWVISGVFIPFYHPYRLMNEDGRQLVHLVFGLLIAGAIAFLGREYAIMGLTSGLFGGFVLIDLMDRGCRVPIASAMVENLERTGRMPGYGAVCFVLSALFCLVFFPVDYVVAGVLTLAVLDSVSTIVGMRFGRHRISNGKSLEGTAGGIIAAFIPLVFILSPLTAAAAAVVAGIAELFSPIEDNLVIPPLICLLCSLLA